MVRAFFSVMYFLTIERGGGRDNEGFLQWREVRWLAL